MLITIKEVIVGLKSIGITDEEIMKGVGIQKKTLNRWKNSKKEPHITPKQFKKLISFLISKNLVLGDLSSSLGFWFVKEVHRTLSLPKNHPDNKPDYMIKK